MTQLQLISPAELEAHRDLWRGGAAREKHGKCDRCKRVRDDDGKPLLVTRQERARTFLCLRCFVEKLPRRRRRA